jgi:prepilin-type N-terminal cleavage/methylation domain-containing protein
MKSRRMQAGFTLLELMMVVIILAILASIALPQYLRVSERTRAAEALNMLAAIRSSELRFRANSPTDIYNDFDAGGNWLLDIGVPGYNGVAASTLWAYTASGTAAGSNAIATRQGGPGGAIEIDLDTGAVCTTAANPWGVLDIDGC